MQSSEIFYPSSIAELCELLDKNQGLLLVAGGTGIAGIQTARYLEFPSQVASIGRIPELKKTVRTEQFLETGCCTTLTGLLSLANGTLPAELVEVLGNIGNRSIRNAATIGGNLCDPNRFMDLWPILVCLDTQIEFRSKSSDWWASVSHLSAADGKPGLPESALLTRIRIPRFSYSFAYCKKAGPSGYPGDENANFACLADVRHGKIGEFRLAYAGRAAFRAKELDLSMAGRKTAAGAKETEALRDRYLEAFSQFNPAETRLFANLLEDAFSRLFS